MPILLIMTTYKYMTDYDYKNSTVLSTYCIFECLTVHHTEYIDGYKVQQDNVVQCVHTKKEKKTPPTELQLKTAEVKGKYTNNIYSIGEGEGETAWEREREIGGRKRV